MKIVGKFENFKKTGVREGTGVAGIVNSCYVSEKASPKG